jgi:transcriptional regulator with XRE-family HTH domain
MPTKFKQNPLGKVLLSARQKLGWSRARVSKEAGIGENSVVRYEKAGIEEGGQYPPAGRLAALAYALDIEPAEALASCLSKQDYKKFGSKTIDADPFGFPLYQSFIEEGVVYAHDNAKLRMMLRVLLLEREGTISVPKEAEIWIREEFYKISKAVERDEDDIFYVDDDQDDDELEEIVTINGSGLPAPSRSMRSKNNTEAVGAASINPKKRTGQ